MSFRNEDLTTYAPFSSVEWRQNSLGGHKYLYRDESFHVS